MDLTTQLLGTLPKQQQQAGANVQVKLTSPLPSGTPVPVQITVGETLPNPQTGQPQTTLTLPNGQTLTAIIQPQLPAGTQLTLPRLPHPSTPTQLTAQLVKAIITPPANPPISNPQSPTTTPQPLTLNNLPAKLLTQLAAASLPPANQLPPGPAQITFPQPLTAAALQALQPNPTTPQPLTLTPTQPAQPGQPQPVTLTPTNPTNTTLPQPPTPALLQSGQPLPTNQPVQVHTLPNPSLLTSHSPSPIPNSQLTIALPATPFSAPATATPQIPITPSSLQGLKILFGQNQQPPIPQGTTQTVTARILIPPSNPPIPNSQSPIPTTQTALLSTGQTVQLQSPIPLPSGTVLTMALDFTSPTTGIQTTVLRLTPTNSQPQPQHQQTNPQTTTQQAPVQTVQAPPPPGTLVQATVTGQTAGSPPQAILTLTTPQFAGQTFTLPTSQSLPVGTSVQLQFQPNLQAALLSFSLPSGYLRSHTGTTLAQHWPTLTQGLHHLDATNPSLAEHTRQTLSPQAFLPTFLGYAASLLSDNPTAPLPREAAALLASLGHDLAPDLTQLQTLAKQPDQPDQWRGFFFPYLEEQGGDPRQGRFFWRQQKNEQDEDDKPRTRFVLEVNFTQLGELQLDGLVTYPELWLRLRSRHPLDPAMVQQLQALTTSTLGALGLTGGISAETTQTFPINPLADLLREDPTTVSVET